MTPELLGSYCYEVVEHVILLACGLAMVRFVYLFVLAAIGLFDKDPTP